MDLSYSMQSKLWKFQIKFKTENGRVEQNLSKIPFGGTVHTKVSENNMDNIHEGKDIKQLNTTMGERTRRHEQN